MLTEKLEDLTLRKAIELTEAYEVVQANQKVWNGIENGENQYVDRVKDPKPSANAVVNLDMESRYVNSKMRRAMFARKRVTSRQYVEN